MSKQMLELAEKLEKQTRYVGMDTSELLMRAAEFIRSSAVSVQPLRRCSYCKTWHSKPCGEQCHWNPTDPTAPPHTEPQAASAIESDHLDLEARLRSLAHHWRGKGYPSDADVYELAAGFIEKLRCRSQAVSDGGGR